MKHTKTGCVAHAVLCCSVLCHAMPCYAMLCHVMHIYYVYIQSYVHCAIYIGDALQTASADDS